MKTKIMFTVFLFSSLVFSPLQSMASQDQTLIDEVKALRLELNEMKKQLSAVSALNPNFTSFMPEFSERFHVMHLAGEAGDWAVAEHELLELQRMIGVAQIIDATKGLLLKSFMEEHFHKIKTSIDHGNKRAFLKNLEATVVSCNTCHVAVKAPYIRTSLAVQDIVSLRHSHKLGKSKVSMGGGHTH